VRADDLIQSLRHESILPTVRMTKADDGLDRQIVHQVLLLVSWDGYQTDQVFGNLAGCVGKDHTMLIPLGITLDNPFSTIQKQNDVARNVTNSSRIWRTTSTGKSSI
jgi:hypothetical protein